MSSILSFNFLEVGTIAKDKSLKKAYTIVGIVAAIVAIFVGINGLVNSEGNGNGAYIKGDNNGNVIVGENNTLVGTIINKVTSIFISPSEKKDENSVINTSSEDPIYSNNNTDDKRSNLNVPGEDISGKTIYDENFSISGNVGAKSNPFGGSYNELEDGILRINIPDDEGKYYRINVTTYDATEVGLSSYFVGKYEYKKDKFSDFTSATQEFGKDGGTSLGLANKMENINATVYVCPISESYCWDYIKIMDPGLEPKVTGRSNLSIQLSLLRFQDDKKDGDIVKSNGHIKIVEVDKDEAGYYYNKIG